MGFFCKVPEYLLGKCQFSVTLLSNLKLDHVVLCEW